LTHVVDTSTARPLLLVTNRKPADILPVVLCPEKRNPVRDLHACLEIILHLLVQAPHLRHRRRIAIHLVQDLLLGVDDGLQNRSLDVGRHGSIVVTAHSDGHNILIVLSTNGTLHEKLVEGRIVCSPLPSSFTAFAKGLPFLSGSHHRLSMGRSHDNAVLVSQRLVARVIDVEHASPHSRPKVVGPESQQELEYLGVELGAERAAISRFRVPLVHPTSESGSLIVDEEATVLDSRRCLNFGGPEGVDRVVGLGYNVGKPMPWGHADLLGDIVDSVDCSALVAACEVLALMVPFQGCRNKSWAYQQ
jgi:hypothetical protein